QIVVDGLDGTERDIKADVNGRQPELERHVACIHKRANSSYDKTILGHLGWYMTVPTPYVFTIRYTKASIPFDNNEMENMVLFYTELGLMDYTVIIRNNPLKVAASAVYAARYTLKKTLAWTETLKHHTGYSEDQVRPSTSALPMETDF
ncbi:G2/mitotic-specific cyclin S13-7-like protein, partial [Tanacetum coccineum]